MQSSEKTQHIYVYMYQRRSTVDERSDMELIRGRSRISQYPRNIDIPRFLHFDEIRDFVDL